jgi:cell division transport system permease protein
MSRLLDLVRGDALANRMVPPSGISARLTIFVAAAMAFLAVFALALALTAGRVATSWADELAAAATLRLPADLEQSNAALAAALQVLQTTPGIDSADLLDADAQRALLAPWLGADLPLEDLPLPQIITIIPTADGFDTANLRARLQAEVPGAVLDDHGAWRAPLVQAAGRLRMVGLAVLVVIFAVTAAMITLAAHAALASNAQVIRVLRLVGARDGYIALAFVRRFTLRAGLGGVFGVLAGLVVLQIMPAANVAGGPPMRFGFVGAGWLWPVALPAMSAILAFGATRAAALRCLREQT